MNEADPLLDLLPLESSSIILEEDPVSSIRHYWLHEKENKKWFRISASNNSPIHESGDLSFIQIEAAECKEIKRRIFGLFQSSHEDLFMPINNSKQEIPMKIVNNIRKALLVWSSKNLNASNAQEIAKLFPNAQEMQCGMFITIDDEKPTASLESKENIDIFTIDSQLVENLKKCGTIVNYIKREDAHRVCIGIKQNHGSVETIANGTPRSLQAFLRHQKFIMECQQAALLTAGTDNIHFYIESFSHLPEEMKKDIEIMIENGSEFYTNVENHIQLLESDLISCQKLIDEIRIKVTARKIFEAKQEKAMLTGSNRFISLLIASGKLNPNRFHGHLTINNSDEMKNVAVNFAKQSKDLTDDELDNIINQLIVDRNINAFNLEHPNLLSDIATYTPSNQVAVVVLGSDHFSSGHTTLQSEKLDQCRLENIFLNDNNLSDMNLIVVEPYYLESFNSI